MGTLTDKYDYLRGLDSDKLSAVDILHLEYGDSNNFMTPWIVRRGKITAEIVFELSTGSGFLDSGPLWGVSVVVYNPRSGLTDRHAVKSQCFNSRAAAERYISELDRLYDVNPLRV